jgi:hypothetical protein
MEQTKISQRALTMLSESGFELLFFINIKLVELG